MTGKRMGIFSLCFLAFLVLGCASMQPKLPVDELSSKPGTQVSFRGKPAKLLGTPIELGKPLPSVPLVDAMTMEDVDLSKMTGQVLFLSIVPSLDTPVCEAQTHYLSEQGNQLPSTIKRIAISRDTPFAQKRFAKEAKLMNIQYLSDYREGAFGRATGLLMENLMLLARSVVIVDRQGVVQYIQVVPEISHLPEMDKAFQKAIELAK